MNIRWFNLALLLGISATFGCASPASLQNPPDTIRLHVIAVDSDGVAHDPVTDKRMTPVEFAAQVKSMLDAMDAFHDQKEQGAGAKKILIFVHGGLNTPQEALGGADNEIDQMQRRHYYPIFVNWQSDLNDSYGEHLTSVTQGQKEYAHPGARALASPFYFTADFARAIGRAPVVWMNQAGSDTAAFVSDVQALSDSKTPGAMPGWVKYRGQGYIGKLFAELYDNYKQDLAQHPNGPHEQIQISIGNDTDVKFSHLAGIFTSYWITVIPKFGTSWVIDGLGKSAWDNLTRRTFVIFEGKAGGNPPQTSHDPKKLLINRQALLLRSNAALAPLTTRQTSTGPVLDPPDWESIGAVDYLKNQLGRRISDHSPQCDAWSKYEITLIGHSMGTMVLNEWVRRNDEDGMYYKNIVYMAAACSIRSFSQTIVPYLRAHRNHDDPRGTTLFYNLTLHPTAELREKNRPTVGDLPARGSLLVWIDDFLADPATARDRTLGRWDNLPQTVSVITRDIRGQITFRAMSLDPDDKRRDQGGTAPDPQTHGAFRGFPYWEASFWHAAPPSDAQDRISEMAKSAE